MPERRATTTATALRRPTPTTTTTSRIRASRIVLAQLPPPRPRYYYEGGGGNHFTASVRSRAIRANHSRFAREHTHTTFRPVSWLLAAYLLACLFVAILAHCLWSALLWSAALPWSPAPEPRRRASPTTTRSPTDGRLRRVRVCVILCLIERDGEGRGEEELPARRPNSAARAASQPPEGAHPPSPTP